MEKILVSKFQEQFWLLNMLAPSNSVYNIPTLLKFESEPDINILERALNLLIERHEILRTSFSFEEGKILQKINKPQDCIIHIKIFELENEININEGVPSSIILEINKPFDLKIAPLLRCSIYKNVNQPEIFLCIVFHHIVVDLHSKIIFEKELSTLYNSLLHNNIPILEDIPNQYSDYSKWHNDWLKGSIAQSLISDLHKFLPPINTVIELPFDYQRPKFSQQKGSRKFFSFSADISLQIKEFAIKQSTNTFMVFLTVYSILLHRLSQQNTIVIGVPFSNRKDDRYKNTFGPFVNALPVTIKFSKDLSFIEILGQIRQQMLILHRKQEIPYITLVNSSVEKRTISYNSFYQVGFTFEPPIVLTLNNVKSESIPIERSGSQLDMFVTMWEEEEKFKGYFEFSTDLFQESTIDQYIENYKSLVESSYLNPALEIEKL